jgi:hypothetical protein
VRAIVRDGTQAFVGSQSLRRLELDRRREVGLIINNPSVSRAILAVFDRDWEASAPKAEKKDEKDEKKGRKDEKKDQAAGDKDASGPPVKIPASGIVEVKAAGETSGKAPRRSRAAGARTGGRAAQRAVST